MKVLVVDDSSFARHMIARMVESGGHEVVEADNGQAAFAAIEEHRPDCVLMDLLMPVMNGFEFLRILRSRDSALRVVVVSADIQESAREECQSLGVSAYLCKPPRSTEVEACLARIRVESEGVT